MLKFYFRQIKEKFNYDWGVIEINGGAGFEYSLKKEIEKEQIEYDYEEFGDAMIEEIILFEEIFNLVME